MLWLKSKINGSTAEIYVRIEILTILNKCKIKIPKGMYHNLLVQLPLNEIIKIVNRPKIFTPLQGSPIQTPWLNG